MVRPRNLGRKKWAGQTFKGSVVARLWGSHHGLTGMGFKLSTVSLKLLGPLGMVHFMTKVN